jgi:hypothetical protein
MPYTYKVVPFIGRNRGALSASDVAQQLETAICQHASDGWEFVQLSDVNIEVQPGCLGGLLGAKVEYARIDQLIFRGDLATHTLHQTKTATQVVTPRPASKSTRTYEPEVLPNGKVQCWNCGESNRPEQDNCWACYSKLYERG